MGRAALDFRTLLLHPAIWQVVRHVTHWKQAVLDAWTEARPLFVAGQIRDLRALYRAAAEG